jgi:hypothetical protein
MKTAVGRKLVSIDPFDELPFRFGKCPFPALNGHHHERSTNILSDLSTFKKTE